MFASVLRIIAVIVFLTFLGLMFFTKGDKNKKYLQFILLAYPLLATFIIPGYLGIKNFDLITWVFFIGFYKSKKTEVYFGKTYLFLFLIILLISIIGCYFAPSLTIETFRNYIEFFSIFIFAKILIDECIYEPKYFYIILDCLKTTLKVGLVFLVCQFIFGVQFNINKELNMNVFQDDIIRYPGFFQDPQKFGQFLAVSSFLFLIKKPDEEKLPAKNYLFLALSIVALLYTGGRAASGGWLLGFSLIVIFGNSKLKLYSILLAIVMFLVIYSFKDNFAVLNRGDNLSDSYDWRHAIWTDAIGIVKDNLYFGIAPGNYEHYVSLHNPNQFFVVENQVIFYDQPESGYLKWLTEYGIFGFVSILLLLILPMINSLILYLKKKDTTSLLLISPILCWMVSYYTVYSFADRRIQILIVTITCLSITFYKNFLTEEVEI